jgi:predicted MFS family arabinose efflux permease
MRAASDLRRAEKGGEAGARAELPHAHVTAESAPASFRHRPGFLLFVLTLVGAINWADRQVVPILFPGIRAELGLSDTELGVIGGPAFSLIYAVSAFLFGRAADRRIRRNVIAVGLVAWSAATAAGAFASSFGSLFAARFFTGIGEASLYPAAMSLLAESFPGANRGRAMGIFGSASALGGGLGIGLGGMLAQEFGWRSVFLIYGACGLLLLPLLMSVPERPRTTLTATPESASKTLMSFLSDPRLLLLWASGMVMMASGFGYSTWAPSFFVRERGLDVSASGQIFGLSVLIGGVAGSLIGGALADRGRKRRLAGELDVSALAGLISAPLALAPLVITWMPAYVAFAILCPIAIFAFFPSLQTMTLHIVPPRHHGLAYALNMLFLAGIGIAIGPFIVGRLSDAFGLKTAMYVPVGGMVVGALLIALTGRTVRARESRSV